MEILSSLLTSSGHVEIEANIPEVIVNYRKPGNLISAKAIELIKHFESAHDGDLKKPDLQPKMDPVGIWTAGYGHVLISNGRMLQGEKDRKLAQQNQYSNLTMEQATDLLMKDLTLKYLPEVWRVVKRTDLTQDQMGALVAFCYNCGTHYVNRAGKKVPFALWANVNNRVTGKAMWDYWRLSVTRSQGKTLPGLVRRRKSEAYLYLKGIVNLNLKDNWV